MPLIFKKENWIVVFRADNKHDFRGTYYKKVDFNPPFIVNPNHAFFYKGFVTYITADNAAETINPLDFKSQYDAKAFKTAIESKIVKETFDTLKETKFNLPLILGIANAALSVVILYFMLKG